MSSLKVAFFLTCLVVTATTTATGGLRPKVDLAAHARSADQVVVASVERKQSRFERNAFGDELIVSDLVLRVSEGMKGARRGDAIVMTSEGGTVGDVTLEVSDLPALKVGQRGVFFLSKGPHGVVPHGRGLGILKLTEDDQVAGEPMNLNQVRAIVLAQPR